MSDAKITELYDSRNDHHTRLAVVESSIKQIASNSDETKKSVQEFIKAVNGLPMNNAKEISQMKVERCIPMASKVDGLRKMSWMILGMAVLLSILIGGGILGLVFKWF